VAIEYVSSPIVIVLLRPTLSDRAPDGIAIVALVSMKEDDIRPICIPIVAPRSSAYRGRKGPKRPKPSITLAAAIDSARMEPL